MAGITLAQAEAKLATWLACEEAIAEKGQSYTVGQRTFTRANLKEVREAVAHWDGKVKELDRGVSGVRLRGLSRG